MGYPASHPISDPEGPVQPVQRGLRRCFGTGLGAGSMVALLLVLTVLPGAAAFAAPEAMGHISIILHEVVRPKPDRDPREPGVSQSDRQSIQAIAVASPRVLSFEQTRDESGARSQRAMSHAGRAEVFAARPWCTSTPPPAN